MTRPDKQMLVRLVHLKAVDIDDNAEILVPCIILETHPEIEVV